MQLVDHDTFIQRLTHLFQSSVEHGTIWLTHKRLTHNDEDVAMKPATGEIDTQEYPCLVRVTNGKEEEFSTRVNSSELEKFFSAYSALIKSSMSSLRKRDKKREKIRGERAAERKKRMTEPIMIDGPKRGAGRRKRQRMVKATLKQKQSQAKFKEREEARAKKIIVVGESA